MNKWYTYVILCDDGSLYKGHTGNIERRYRQHITGQGANHTKTHKPVELVYYEDFETQIESVNREKYLKTGAGREWLEKKLEEVGV